MNLLRFVFSFLVLGLLDVDYLVMDYSFSGNEAYRWIYFMWYNKKKYEKIGVEHLIVNKYKTKYHNEK